MKKILILTILFIVSLLSMNFRGCIIPKYKPPTSINEQESGKTSPGDYSTDAYYSIYAGDNGVILRSSGESNIIFEQKNSGTTERLNCVRVATSGTQIVIAGGNNGTIVRSTDEGNSWSGIASVTSANLYGMDFRNGGYYYAAGDNGTLLISVTDGIIWNQISSGTTRNLKAIGINPVFASTVVAIGEKGTILRTTNSGINWTNVSLSDTSINFYDISKKGFYFNANIFCIVGTGGRIYKSTDQGATWIQKPSGTTNTLRSIYFHTIDSAIVVGDNGTIRCTTDGGESWFTDSFFDSPQARQYKSVSLVNRDHYTFSALSDTIFFASNDPVSVGIESISSDVPKGFSLSQNYPNPFNPSTNFEFRITSFGLVSITVYDIQGREIATLLNEELKPGTYKIDFDGSKYSSGVYFYKMTTDEFAETKRMILIK